METSMEQPKTELLAEDFANIDSILDDVEASMLHIADDKKLIGAHIERWRWDVPEVTMSWKDPVPEISRNMRFCVHKSGSFSYAFAIDINDWYDQSFAGRGTQRLWRNRTLFEGNSVLEKTRGGRGGYSEMLYQAYAELSQWGLEDLKQTHVFAGGNA